MPTQDGRGSRKTLQWGREHGLNPQTYKAAAAGAAVGAAAGATQSWWSQILKILKGPEMPGEPDLPIPIEFGG